MMGRASRADAELHRQQVIDAAGRLFRERGIDQVSIPDVMAAAGLTHGGFYRHFASKDELVALAADAAFTTSSGIPTSTQPFAAYLADYLSTDHRDAPARGCPITGLEADVARSPAGSPVRAVFTAGVRARIDQFVEFTGGDPADPDERPAAIAELCLMVGALALARATAGDPVSEEILAAARAAVIPDPESA
jgi:TetR/AcrR family transcriptional repressor of nem operon